RDALRCRAPAAPAYRPDGGGPGDRGQGPAGRHLPVGGRLPRLQRDPAQPLRQAAGRDDPRRARGDHWLARAKPPVRPPRSAGGRPALSVLGCPPRPRDPTRRPPELIAYSFSLIELRPGTISSPWPDSPLHWGEGHRRFPPGVI